MKKIITLILVLTAMLPSVTGAQQKEQPKIVVPQRLSWTSATVHTGMEYSMQSLCPPLKLLSVGGISNELSWRTDSPGMYDGKGNEILKQYDYDYPGYYIFTYDYNGNLKWHYHFNKNAAALQNFAYDNNNNLVALVWENDMSQYDNYYEEEEEEEGDEEEQESKEGYRLYFFDSTGNVLHITPIPQLNAVEITDMKSHPLGGFVIAGHADDGKIAKNLSLDSGPGGSDFILYLHSDGSIAWGDVLSYKKETCCTYGGDPKIAVDEKGNIFLGGTYVGGAKFGGSVIKLAPVPYNPGPHYDAMESYVAAYSPQGKFLWVNTAGCRAGSTAIAAAKGYVYVSTAASRQGAIFEHSVDTGMRQHVFITVFDTKGNFKKNISTGAGSSLSLSTDLGGNLVATGTIGVEVDFLKRKKEEEGKWRREDCFIAFYAPGGTFKKHFLADMLVISSDEPPVCMAESTEVFFLTGNLFASLQLPLSVIDAGFPEIKFQGSAPFVARWKAQ